MRNGTYYLNNRGSRWVVLNNGKREWKFFQTKSGRIIKRVVNYYESFGNFATCNIAYKGKLINVFRDSLLDD